jgi:adenine deaminase
MSSLACLLCLSLSGSTSSGTTGIFIDPHEIANVFGLEEYVNGEDKQEQPIHVWVQVPPVCRQRLI